MNRYLQAKIEDFLAVFKLEIKKIGNPRDLWNDDQGFNEIYHHIRHLSLVDKKRCHVFYQLARAIRPVAGDVAEIGVYRGGTARILAEVLAQDKKTIHLFDTFTGMPPTDAGVDIHEEGDFGGTSIEAVIALLKDFKNIRMHPGRFPETAQPVESSRFSFVHVDVDINQSVLDCCRFFYPRLNPGGIMIFDDYGFVSCPGAKKAVDDFFVSLPESPVYLPTGQCFIIKH